MAQQSSNKEIGNRIKMIRINLNLNMENFGKLFNPPANKSLISKWENGKSLPNVTRLNRIAELGNISTHFLLTGEKIISDLTSDEYDELLNSEKKFDDIWEKTRGYQIDKYLERISQHQLSDSQLEFIRNALQMVLDFEEHEKILVLFSSILENSYIVLDQQVNGKTSTFEDPVHSAVLLENDLDYLKSIIDIDKF